MPNSSDEQTDLEAELRDLILRAFADGEDVSGSWEITSVPDEIPDWTVTIQRTTEEARSEGKERIDPLTSD